MLAQLKNRITKMTAFGVAGLVGLIIGVLVIPGVAQDIVNGDDECLVYERAVTAADSGADNVDLVTTEDHDDDDEHEDGDSCGLLEDATLTLDEVIAMAEAEIGGTAMNVELEREDGRLVFGVTTTSGFEIEYDASSGELLEIEIAD